MDVEVDAGLEVQVNGGAVHSLVHQEPDHDSVIGQTSVEPTTTGNVDGCASNGTDGKHGETNTKITTANITISHSTPKRKLSVTLPKSQYDTGIEVNFSEKQAYFSEPPAAAAVQPCQQSNLPDGMQSDDAGKESPTSVQQASPGDNQGHQRGPGGAATAARLEDSLTSGEAAPQQRLNQQNGQHSWEAELSFAMSSGGAEPTATTTAEHEGSQVSGLSGGSAHCEPQFEGGEIENEPEVRQDVVRESDRRDGEELPEQGLARSLLSRFKDIESEAQHTKQKEHKPSGVAVKATPTPLRPAPRQSPEDGVDGSGGGDVPRLQERAEVENEPVVRTDVVKESDTNVTEELPERGMARNLLSKFKTMEVEAQQRSEYKPSGVSARTWKGVSGQSPSLSSSSSATHREPTFEGGDVENTPQVRMDVVRESDSSVGEELPERGLAQSLLSRFKTLESEATKKQEYKPSGVAHKATPSKMHIMAGRSVYVPDGTTKGGPAGAVDAGPNSSVHEPQFEGGEFENTPEVRVDVIKESDRVQDEDLPQQGLAKNLLSRFKSIEAEASVQKDYVPSGIGSKPTPTPLGLANTAVGRRPASSAYEGSADSRGSSSERDFASAAYDSPAAADGGEYENEPAPRPEGVVSSSDHNDQDELPESGLAQSVLSKFKSLESQMATDYQPSGVGSKAVDAPVVLRGASRPEHDVASGMIRELPVGHLDESWSSNVGLSLDGLGSAVLAEPLRVSGNSRCVQPTLQAWSCDQHVTVGIFASAESTPDPTAAADDSTDCALVPHSSSPLAVAPSSGSGAMSVGQPFPALGLPDSVFHPDETACSPATEDSLLVVPSAALEVPSLSPSPPSTFPRHDLPNQPALAHALDDGVGSSCGQASMPPRPDLTVAMPVFCPLDVHVPAPADVATDLDASIALPRSLTMDDGAQVPQFGSSVEPCSLFGSLAPGNDGHRELIGSISSGLPAIPSSSVGGLTLESAQLGCEDYQATASSQPAAYAGEDGSAAVAQLESNNLSELSSDSLQTLSEPGAGYNDETSVPNVSNPDNSASNAGDHQGTSGLMQLPSLCKETSLISVCRDSSEPLYETEGPAASYGDHSCTITNDVLADVGCSCCAQHCEAICPGIIMDVLLYGSMTQDICTRCSTETKAYSQKLLNTGGSVRQGTEISPSSINLTFSREDLIVVPSVGDDRYIPQTTSDVLTTDQSTQSSTNVDRSDCSSSNLQVEKGHGHVDDVTSVEGTPCMSLAGSHNDNGQALQLESLLKSANLPMTVLQSCEPGDNMHHLDNTQTHTSLGIPDEPPYAVLSHHNIIDAKIHITSEAADLNAPHAKPMHPTDKSGLALQSATQSLVSQLRAENVEMCSAQGSSHIELEAVPAGLSVCGQLSSNTPTPQTANSDDAVARPGNCVPSEEAVLALIPQASPVEANQHGGVSGVLSLKQSHSHAPLIVEEVLGVDGCALTLHVVPDGTGTISATAVVPFQSVDDRPGNDAAVPDTEIADSVATAIDDATMLLQPTEGSQADHGSVLTNSGHQRTDNMDNQLIDIHAKGKQYRRPDSFTSQCDSVLLSDFCNAAQVANGVNNVSRHTVSTCRSPPSTPVNPEDDPATGQSQLNQKKIDGDSSRSETELIPEVAQVLVNIGTCLLDDEECSCREKEVAHVSAVNQVGPSNSGSGQKSSLDTERVHQGDGAPQETSASSTSTGLCGVVDNLLSSAAVAVDLTGLAIPVDSKSYGLPTAGGSQTIVLAAEHTDDKFEPEPDQHHPGYINAENCLCSTAGPPANSTLAGCDHALESLQLGESEDDLHKQASTTNVTDAVVAASGQGAALSHSATSLLLTIGKGFTNSEATPNSLQDQQVLSQGVDSMDKRDDHEYMAFSDVTSCSTLDLDQVLLPAHNAGNADSVAPTANCINCGNCYGEANSLDAWEKQSWSEHSVPHLQTETVRLYDCLTDCGTIPDLATACLATASVSDAVFDSAIASVTMMDLQFPAGNGTQCSQPTQLSDGTPSVIADSGTSDDNATLGYQKSIGWPYADIGSNSIFPGTVTSQDPVSLDRSITTSVASELPGASTLPSACILLQGKGFAEGEYSSSVLSLSEQDSTNLSGKIASSAIVSSAIAPCSVPPCSLGAASEQSGWQSGSATPRVESADTATILKMSPVSRADTTSCITMVPYSAATASADLLADALPDVVQVHNTRAMSAPALQPSITRLDDCSESKHQPPICASEQTSSGSAGPSTMSCTDSMVYDHAFKENTCEETVLVVGPSDPAAAAVAFPAAPKLAAYLNQKELATSSMEQVFEPSSNPVLCSSATTDHLPAESILAVHCDTKTTPMTGSLSRNDVAYELPQQPGAMAEIDLTSTFVTVQELAAADLSTGETVSITTTHGLIGQQQSQTSDSMSSTGSEKRHEADDRFTPIESVASADLLAPATEVAGANASGEAGEQIALHTGVHPDCSRPMPVDQQESPALHSSNQIVKQCLSSTDGTADIQTRAVVATETLTDGIC